VAVVGDAHFVYRRVVHEELGTELAAADIEHLHAAAHILVLNQQAVFTVDCRGQEEVSFLGGAQLEGNEWFESFGTVDVCSSCFVQD